MISSTKIIAYVWVDIFEGALFKLLILKLVTRYLRLELKVIQKFVTFVEYTEKNAV